MSQKTDSVSFRAQRHVIRRTILGAPEKDHGFTRGNLWDVAVNVVGFAPFGFILAAWLRSSKSISAPTAYSFAILSGFCISLAIELTQAYLPMRDSSLLDVISNTLGTATGVLLLKYAFPLFRGANESSG